VGRGSEDMLEACTALIAWRMGDAVEGLSAIITRSFFFSFRYTDLAAWRIGDAVEGLLLF
jgi:hypothetical protein